VVCAQSQRQIARELDVSLDSTKTPCTAIYRKVGVRDCNSAVQAARDLALL
jgi:ATP/maltotriose-dependent transcriptional regulator MalT